MKFKIMTPIALCAMAIMSCDEDTTNIGGSLTNDNDKLVVSTMNYNVLTSSEAVDSVYSRERQCYFGKVKDPETNTYVKSLFTAQFYMMENIQGDLPAQDSILSLENGQVIADSCVLHIFLDTKSSYGDTLTAMKLKVSELSRPIEGPDIHYTNFDPRKKGFIREDGLQVNQMFTIRDLTSSDSIRNLINTNMTTSTDNGYNDMLRVRLNAPYTDKDGVVYKNYGTYILRNYYDHPEYFKNSYTFLHRLCPGFQFETTDGLGVMARVMEVDMMTYFRYMYEGDTLTTYLRTTISDSLLSAKVVFNRINNQTEAKELSFNAPSKLLLIEKDSLNNFFEGNNLANNTYAYKTTLVSNAYTYTNISNLITRMYNHKVEGLKTDPNWVANHPNWNKAMLVPIDEVTIASGSNSSSTTAVALKNQLGLTSTRLLRGTAESPITIEVIYAKFKD